MSKLKRRRNSSADSIMRGRVQSIAEAAMERYAKRVKPDISISAPEGRVEFYDTVLGDADFDTSHGTVIVNSAVRIVIPTPEYDSVTWYIFDSLEAGWREFLDNLREFHPSVAKSMPKSYPLG